MNIVYAIAGVGLIVLVVGFFIQKTLNEIADLLQKLIDIQLLTKILESIDMEKYIEDNNEQDL